MKSFIIVLLAVVLLGSIAWAEDTISLTFESTPHIIRFQGNLIVGGDVLLYYSDLVLLAEQTTFDKWFEKMTIKELRDRGYLIDIIHRKEITK